jgi:hypothetical protein
MKRSRISWPEPHQKDDNSPDGYGWPGQIVAKAHMRDTQPRATTERRPGALDEAAEL